MSVEKSTAFSGGGKSEIFVSADMTAALLNRSQLITSFGSSAVFHNKLAAATIEIL